MIIGENGGRPIRPELTSENIDEKGKVNTCSWKYLIVKFM